jgi:histidine triad (HIT) family protein
VASLFSRIVSGEIPCHLIYEDEHYLAFLDVFPLVEGHCLVIPKMEVDYIFDLDDDVLAGLFLVSKKVAKAIGKAIPCKKVGISVIGLEVPHTHVHLIPMNKVADMNFTSEKKSFSKEEMEMTAMKIRQCM